MKDFETRWKSGEPETPCGAGSTLEGSKQIRELLPQIVHRHRIRSIANVGCGDLHWWPKIVLPYDVTNHHYDVHYQPLKFNAITDVLPRAYDLILTNYVLNHIYVTGGVQSCIDNFKASGSVLLLSTDCDSYPLTVGEQLESHAIYDAGGKYPKEWNYRLWKL